MMLVEAPANPWLALYASQAAVYPPVCQYMTAKPQSHDPPCVHTICGSQNTGIHGQLGLRVCQRPVIYTCQNRRFVM